MPSPAAPHPEDLELARLALRGDAAARHAFCLRMRCVPRLLFVMNRRQRRPLPTSELEDLVQDTLATIWRRLDSFEGLASLETWSYRFCAFQLANRLRSVARQPVTVPLMRTEAPDGDPTDLWAYEDVHRALDALEHNVAAVIRLKHFEHLSFDEIGSRLEVSPNTAKTRYYRGLEQLRAALWDRASGMNERGREET